MKARLSILISLIFSALVCCQSAFAQRIMIYGDSLSAGYGIDTDEGWVALLATKLDEAGHSIEIINASISGETSAGGLARLPHTLMELKPDLVLLELGANDGLRGLPTADLEANLIAMVEQLSAAQIQTAIVGISVPPSYGPRYIDQFRAVFPRVASQFDLPFIDLYIEDFFLQPGFIQADGLHPTAKAQPRVADLMLEFLRANELVH